MKIRMTFEFDDRQREALAAHYGDEGKASREDVRQWLESVVHSALETIVYDHEPDTEEPNT